MNLVLPTKWVDRITSLEEDLVLKLLKDNDGMRMDWEQCAVQDGMVRGGSTFWRGTRQTVPPIHEFFCVKLRDSSSF